MTKKKPSEAVESLEEFQIFTAIELHRAGRIVFAVALDPLREFGCGKRELSPFLA